MGWYSMQSEPRGDYRRSTYLALIILTNFVIIIIITFTIIAITIVVDIMF